MQIMKSRNFYMGRMGQKGQTNIIYKSTGTDAGNFLSQNNRGDKQ